IAVACSKGTYVRSLIADIGHALGVGAHLAELRRTRSGRFTIEQAVSLERLADAGLGSPAQATRPPSGTLAPPPLPPVPSGNKLPVSALGAEGFGQFQIVDECGVLLAVAHGHAGRTRYDRVFPELRAAGRGA